MPSSESMPACDPPFPPDLYVISLRGPWILTSGDPERIDSLQQRVKLPEDWPIIFSGNLGTVLLNRRFQRPTNLDPEEKTLLMLPPGCRPSETFLNGTPLAFDRQLADWSVAETTSRLARTNCLTLQFSSPDSLPADSTHAVLIGIMPDADGSWWASLKTVVHR